ncbi:MAG TPA: flagellar hook-length control protein FliK, partial [Azoarcus sp.]|nr:flagellar hook-length control protein FliK [Azoarcus sp.]
GTRQTSLPGTSSTTARAETNAERPLDTLQAAASRTSTAPVVAERLMPLVHQQLDAMATQQYVLYGQAWPGQHFEWELDDPAGQGGEGEEGSEEGWNSALRLTMPQLGEVEARLHFNPAGIAVRLLTADAHATDRLNAARERLENALSAAGIRLTGFVAEERNA